MSTTAIMNASAAITTTMTMAEAAEKVSVLTKAKSFVKEHKTAFAVGGTAVAGVATGILIDKGIGKAKDAGFKNKLKSKKKPEKENNNSNSEDILPEEECEKIIEEDIAANTAAEKAGEEPTKETCEKECDQQHSA